MRCRKLMALLLALTCLTAGAQESETYLYDGADTVKDLLLARDVSRQVVRQREVPDTCTRQVPNGTETVCEQVPRQDCQTVPGQCYQVPRQDCHTIPGQCHQVPRQDCRTVPGDCRTVPRQRCRTVPGQCRSVPRQECHNPGRQCRQVSRQECQDGGTVCENRTRQVCQDGGTRCRRMPDGSQQCEPVPQVCRPETTQECRPAGRQCRTVYEQECHDPGPSCRTVYDRDCDPDRTQCDTEYEQECGPSRQECSTRYERECGPDQQSCQTRYEQQCDPDQQQCETRYEQECRQQTRYRTESYACTRTESYTATEHHFRLEAEAKLNFPAELPASPEPEERFTVALGADHRPALTVQASGRFLVLAQSDVPALPAEGAVRNLKAVFGIQLMPTNGLERLRSTGFTRTTVAARKVTFYMPSMPVATTEVKVRLAKLGTTGSTEREVILNNQVVNLAQAQQQADGTVKLELALTRNLARGRYALRIEGSLKVPTNATLLNPAQLPAPVVTSKVLRF